MKRKREEEEEEEEEEESEKENIFKNVRFAEIENYE